MEADSVQTPPTEGLPSRYGREARRRLRAELGCLIPLLCVFGLGTWLYAALVVYEPGIFSFAGLLVFGAPFCLLAAALVSEVLRAVRDKAGPGAPRIVPFFDQRLGLDPDDAPGNGYALVRHCRLLDELAAKRDVTPLTHLGLYDDLSTGSPQWRDPKIGLRTVRALLDEVSDSSIELADDERAAVTGELRLLKAALEKAEKAGASYCLLLRTSQDTPLEPGGLDPEAGSFS